MSKKEQGTRQDESKTSKIMSKAINPLVCITKPKEPSPEQEECMTDRFITFLETEIEEIEKIDAFSTIEGGFRLNMRYAMIRDWLNNGGYDLWFYKGQVMITPMYDYADPDDPFLLGVEALEHENDDLHGN